LADSLFTCFSFQFHPIISIEYDSFGKYEESIPAELVLSDPAEFRNRGPSLSLLVDIWLLKSMRIGSKLLLGFIPLAILTAMVAEVLYVNSQRINDSSHRVKEAYRHYSNLLEMRRQEKNFSFYREKFYLERMQEASSRAAESLSQLKDLAEGNETIFPYHRAQAVLKDYQRIIQILLSTEDRPEVEKQTAELEALGHQLEKMAERAINLSWLPIQVATRKAQTYSWIFALQAGLIGVVLAFFFSQLLVKPVRQLLRVTKKVAEGDFSRVVLRKSKDEIGELAESFDRMVASLEQGRTQLQKSSQELRGIKETLENIVQSSVDAIVATDPKGRITFANRSMEEMILGQAGQKERLLGVPMARFYSGGLAEARKIMSILREHGRLMNYETTMTGEGRVIPILTSASLLKDERGAVIGTLGVIKDLTEKKKLEEDLKKAQADLVHTEKLAAIGRLASGVAHEMNDPLTSVLTFGNLLREDTPEGNPNRESLDIIVKEATRAQRIVSDLLSFSREAKPSLEWVDLNEVVNMSLLLLEKQGVMEGVEVQLDLAGELPLVRADAGQMQQVFSNLLLNAVQAMNSYDPRRERPESRSRERKLSLHSRFCKTPEEGPSISPSQAGPFIRVVIRDTGSGIAPENLDKVFDPFFSTKGTGEGTGLGLYIVSGILKNYGAEYHLESTVGQGTTFTIDFPLSHTPEF
jgi:two-component system NtrC family sensor kinase